MKNNVNEIIEFDFGLESVQPLDHENARKELQNLIHYWETLSIWEREIVLAKILDGMDETDAPMSQQMDYLVRYNEIEKQQSTKPCSPEEETNPQQKPHSQKCIDILNALPIADLLIFAEFAGMNRQMMALKKPEDIVQTLSLFIDHESTLAAFYGCRNYIGRKYIE